MTKININYLLNRYVADTAVFIVKLHNIHWNIVGDHFLRIHNYTQDLYNHFFESYDSFAEVLKIKGESVFGSMADYLKVASIQELGTNSLKTKESLNIILSDMDLLLMTLKTLRELAHSSGDITCTVLSEDEIRFIEKEMWFIKSMLVD
jgi:starvation-inducible DNA-binding protein